MRVCIVFALLACRTLAWSPSRPPPAPSLNRRTWLSTSAGAGAGLAGLLSIVPPAAAADGGEKLRGISDDKIAEMVKRDLVDGQFLTNGRLTRTIYSEAATFTDEIDTYTLDKWMSGTQKLFVGSKSHVDLVGDVVATKDAVTFRFGGFVRAAVAIVTPRSHPPPPAPSP